MSRADDNWERIRVSASSMVGNRASMVTSEEASMAAKTASSRSFSTSVDIPLERRRKINVALNQHLADSFDLLSQVKQAHWNVKGSDFWQLHKLFDEVAEEVAEWVDQIAERVT